MSSVDRLSGRASGSAYFPSGPPRFGPGLPLRVLLQVGNPAARRLWLWWGLTIIACITLGVQVVQSHWSGVPLRFGGVDFYITVYPPLLLCVLWTLWFGVSWGAIPAYCSSLVLALYAGMPPGWALLFALSNPLGLLVLGTVYRAIRMPAAFAGFGQWCFFITLLFIASVFGATGSFIWSYANQLDTTDAYAIWQGWWLGGFLQGLLLNGPVLLVCTNAVMRWRNRAYPPPPPAMMEKWRLLLTSLLVIAGVLAFLWLSFFLSNGSARIAHPNSVLEWQNSAQQLRDSTIAVYWVLTVLFLAMVFLGYQFFSHWTGELERVAQSLARERDLAELRHQETELARERLEQANQQLAIRMVEVESLQHQLLEQATRDPLTYLFNRRYLHDTLPVELQRAQRQAYPVCVVMIDLDHFKAVNDRHGHAVGDAVLLALAGVLRTGLRATDFTARYGGEEFCLVLADIQPDQALELVQQLQQRYAGLRVRASDGELSGMTFSAGIACYPLDGDCEDALLRAADRALYRAKAEGRDCVRLA
ncbi:GGDEF domain-containing protein [Chitinilyticum piscinae]|uniref:diguanylate cyclase n=1 Tax=Chitinilyticum piscinae TaxID=2866724 RepID=A0A8J7K1X8_9NEIS|nr:GGDEF domain-containing protein [Chitinilyticum piscinae]MBE9609247.1 sensor domain-containing diguanylate cyclase [Chitinilyticum piscinae]